MYWDKTITWFKRSGTVALFWVTCGGVIAGLAQVMKTSDNVCGNAATYMQRYPDSPVCVGNADVLAAQSAGYSQTYVRHEIADGVCVFIGVVGATIVQVCLLITLWYLFLHMVWQFCNAVRGKETYWGKKEEP